MFLSLPNALLDYLNKVRIPDSEIKKREDLCGSCNSKKNILGVEYCGECKCVLHGAVGKIKAPKEKCPLGKW